MKTVFILMQTILIFTRKVLALSLVLKVRVYGTRKGSIISFLDCCKTCTNGALNNYTVSSPSRNSKVSKRE